MPCMPIHMLDSAIRDFIDIVDLSIPARGHWPGLGLKEVTYYEVGKLAFDLLSIFLSRLEALAVSGVQEISTLLRRHPPFRLLTNGPLELEKVKTAQAIENFLKV